MSEMTPKPQRRLPWARLLVVTCAILVLVPCLCLAGAVAFSSAQRRGEHSRWRSMGALPRSGVEILTGDTAVVYVRTATGDIFVCRHQRKVTVEDCWVEAQEPFDVEATARFDVPLFKDELELPPGTVVDTLNVTVRRRDYASESRYVLLQDGTVWRWDYSQVGYFDLIIGALALLAGGVCAIALVVVLWSGVGVRSLWRRASRRSPDIGV
jgi:hypothetical protein